MENPVDNTPESEQPPVGSTIAPEPAKAATSEDTKEMLAEASKEAPSDSSSKGTSSSNITMPAPREKKSRSTLWLVILILVLVAAGAGAWYYLNKKDTPTTSTMKKVDVPLLRFGTTEGLTTEFYPGEVSGIGGLEMSNQVFEGLVGYQDQKIVPLLATKWSNPNTKTWVFTIKKNVTFHNGTKLTTAIVADSLKNPSESVAGQTGFGSIVDTIVATDADTVTITTKSPDALLLKRLLPLVIYDTTATTKNSAENGTGPYTIKSGTTPSNDSLDLVAYSSYHGGTPRVAAIHAVNFADNDAMLASVKKGELDIASDFNGLDASKDFGDQAANFRIADIDPLAVSVLAPIFRTGSPVLKKEVRQAIYKAIDPTKLVATAGGGAAVADQLVTQVIPGYDPTITRPAVDVTGAKALLTTAGYPNGMTLNITFGPPATADVTELQKELAVIGVTLKLNPVKSFPEFQTNIKNGTNDFWFGAYSSSLIDLSDVVNTAVLSTGPFGTYTSVDITRQLAAANQEFDSAKRLKDLQAISKQLMDDVIWMPMRTRDIQAVVRKDLNVTLDVPNGFLGVYDWKVTKNEQ